MKRIVVGLDGSEGSRRALRWVIDNLAGEGTTVVAVNVMRPLGELMLDLPGTGVDQWRDAVQWELAEVWAKPLTEAGVRHWCLTVDGSPSVALAQLAEREHADVLVVGANGHGGVRERMLGGVSFRLPHLAGVPVIVVPAGHPARPAARRDALPAGPVSAQR